MQINPYLNFGGRLAQAFAYYQQHLGATAPMIMTYRGSPAESMATPDWLDKALHAALSIDGQLLMGTDGHPSQHYEGMKGCSLSLSVSSDEEAERIFAALADGGKVSQSLEPSFFASRFGMVVDKFGISWMIIHELPPKSS
ncbi:MAG: VOC family protein [Pseudomonadota bacterium]